VIVKILKLGGTNSDALLMILYFDLMCTTVERISQLMKKHPRKTDQLVATSKEIAKLDIQGNLLNRHKSIPRLVHST
jgi:hypothetical protein